MSRFEDNVQGNMTAVCLQNRIRPDLDGKVKLGTVLDERSPWIYQTRTPERNCAVWLNHFFEYTKIIPWQCTGCWKIYGNPKTLKELFEIREFQKEEFLNLGMNRKCGLETRAFTGNQGGYAMFWYNPLFVGLDKARHNLKLLRENLAEIITTPVEIQLKRGCTEMELHTKRNFNLGSDEWSQLITPMSLEIQKRFEEKFIVPPFPESIPEEMEQLIENRWIDNAVNRCKVSGDWTWKEFRDDNPLAEYVNYGGSIHKVNDFVGGKDGKHYLINLVGRRETEKFFEDGSEEESLLVAELEED